MGNKTDNVGDCILVVVLRISLVFIISSLEKCITRFDLRVDTLCLQFEAGE